MATERCPICNEWLWSWKNKPHRCPPGWVVWISDSEHDDEEDDGRRVYAHDPESAATDFAEQNDPDLDYLFMDDSVEVTVKSLARPDRVHTFTVGGETTSVYSATESKG